jgi:hypothetical protein
MTTEQLESKLAVARAKLAVCTNVQAPRTPDMKTVRQLEAEIANLESQRSHVG